MSKETYFIVGLALGGVIGSFISNKILSKKYNELIDKESKELRAYYKNREKEIGNNIVQETKNVVEPIEEKNEKVEREESEVPHIIDENEFGEELEYDQIYLTLYADGVITDDTDEPIDEKEVRELVGEGNLRMFKYSKEDIMYVRNDKVKAEYELSKDLKEYSGIYD